MSKVAILFKFRLSLNKIEKFGHVAQLDRASDSGSESRGFKSLHARYDYSLRPITLIPLGSKTNPISFKLSKEDCGA